MKKLPGKKRWMSLWRHFYDREKTVEQLTTSMIEWQEKWQWDWIKINPPACYHVLDWGVDYKFYDDPLKEPTQVAPLIRNSRDLELVFPLDVRRGHLGDQLQVIRNLRKHFGPHLPIIETIFAPMEIAHRLASSRQAFLGLARESPAQSVRLLRVITDVFRSFALECLNAGADGIFFATKWASAEWMKWTGYQEYAKSNDLEILQALNKHNALTILHVCGERTFLPQMLDYPADMFSYDFYSEQSPGPAEVAGKTGKWVMGGIDPQALIDHPEVVVEQCRKYSGLAKWLPGPSCVALPQTPDDSIRKVKQALEHNP